MVVNGSKRWLQVCLLVRRGGAKVFLLVRRGGPLVCWSGAVVSGLFAGPTWWCEVCLRGWCGAERGLFVGPPWW
jgi:hypothetical protein